jgi:hypothetical protein
MPIILWNNNNSNNHSYSKYLQSARFMAALGDSWRLMARSAHCTIALPISAIHCPLAQHQKVETDPQCNNKTQLPQANVNFCGDHRKNRTAVATGRHNNTNRRSKEATSKVPSLQETRHRLMYVSKGNRQALFTAACYRCPVHRRAP